MEKNTLIIGASSGIGAAIFQKLQSGENRVFTAGRTIQKSAGHVHFDAETDPFVIPESWPDTFHGFVYCPGTINLKPINRLTRADFLLDYQINVLGFVTVLQTMLPRIKKANGSSVVVFSTVAAQVGLGFHASIAAAKGGLQSLALSLAAELASSHIRVNTIAPSLTDTPLAAHLLNTPEKIEASSKRHPLQRIGNVNDIASMAAYLLSNDASWITGQTLTIDGGMSRLK